MEESDKMSYNTGTNLSIIISEALKHLKQLSLCYKNVVCTCPGCELTFNFVSNFDGCGAGDLIQCTTTLLQSCDIFIEYLLKQEHVSTSAESFNCPDKNDGDRPSTIENNVQVNNNTHFSAEGNHQLIGQPVVKIEMESWDMQETPDSKVQRSPEVHEKFKETAYVKDFDQHSIDHNVHENMAYGSDRQLHQWECTDRKRSNNSYQDVCNKTCENNNVNVTTESRTKLRSLKKENKLHKKKNKAVHKETDKDETKACTLFSNVICNTGQKETNDKEMDVPLFCKFCQKRYWGKALIGSLVRHMGKKHCNGEKYPCHLCEKVYKNVKNAVKHIQYAHDEYCRKFCCNNCPKTFYTKSDFRRHVKCHFLSDNNGLYTCEVCKARFLNRYRLRKHVGQICGKPIYSCNSCEKTFKFKKLCDNHEFKEHSGKYQPVRQFFCHICGHCSGYKSTLKKHIQQVHGEKNQKCSRCDKKFVNESQLKRHYDVQHTEDSEKKHRCSICEKGFGTARLLQKHMAIHSSERPLMCEVCGDTFKTSGTLFNHKKRHVKLLTSLSTQ